MDCSICCHCCGNKTSASLGALLCGAELTNWLYAVVKGWTSIFSDSDQFPMATGRLRRTGLLFSPPVLPHYLSPPFHPSLFSVLLFIRLNPKGFPHIPQCNLSFSLIFLLSSLPAPLLSLFPNPAFRPQCSPPWSLQLRLPVCEIREQAVVTSCWIMYAVQG